MQPPLPPNSGPPAPPAPPYPNTPYPSAPPAPGPAYPQTGPSPYANNPYAAPQAQLDTGYQGQLILAERLTRLGAVILDSLIYLGAMLPGLALMAMSGNRGGDPSPLSIGLMGVGGLAVLVVNLMWLHQSGQTIGKRILNIRILRSDGSQATLGRIFGLRMFVPGLIGNIPVLGPLFAIANPLFIFRNDQRCIHDLMADTIVVKV